MLNRYETLKSSEQKEQEPVDADAALIAFAQSSPLLLLLCRRGSGDRDESADIASTEAALELIVQDDFHLTEVIVSMVIALFTGLGEDDHVQANDLSDLSQEADPAPTSSKSIQAQSVRRIINQKVLERRRLLPPERAMVQNRYLPPALISNRI